MMLRNLRRFGRAKKGLAALEFAIIAPMMIMLLLGSVDLIEALGADKRVQNAASSLADVVSRDDAVSDSEIDGLWTALDLLMYPNGDTGMQVCIRNVSIVNASTTQTVWSEGHGDPDDCTGDEDVTLPDQMMIPGSSVIMAEVHYPYTAPVGYLHSGTMNLSHTVYRRSRLVDPIPRVDND